MNSRFHQLHFGKPTGMIASIVEDIQHVLKVTHINTGVFEFNGKEVYVNTDTELGWCNTVLRAVQNPDSKKIIDIRG